MDAIDPSSMFSLSTLLHLFSQPSTYAALGSLVLLEVVLGIDNLVFIAILADKLPRAQRSHARILGLTLALLMRFVLLSVMSWIIHLTVPIFSIQGHGFSFRDIIMLLGGVFLIYKATIELHERLESSPHSLGSVKNYAGFWVVVTQIIILDAIFSLDAVITAVGMVDHLPVMMLAVTIAMGIMLLASKPLTDFVGCHPTVVVLCLSFLLLIGVSLLAEGMGYGIPKGYLYAAIGFSVLIEFFNQVAQCNVNKSQKNKPFRLRTAEAVIQLMGSRGPTEAIAANTTDEPFENTEHDTDMGLREEVEIVSRVLTFSDRTVRSVMTHRSDVEFLDLEDTQEEQLAMLYDDPPSVLPVCRGGLDNVLGVAKAVTLLADLTKHGSIQKDSLDELIIVPESMRVIKLFRRMQSTSIPFVLVTDEYGTIEGIVTSTDLYEAMAGELPEEGEAPAVQQQEDGSVIVAGTTDVHLLETWLDISGLVSESNDYTSIAGFILSELGRMPAEGDSIEHEGYHFIVKKLEERRIAYVQIRKISE